MRLEEFALGTPGKDEVAVAVSSRRAQPDRLEGPQGAMKIVTGRSFPRGMGLDLAGTVTAVGADVTRFKIGDAVFGMARFKEAGSLAEAVIAKEAALAKKPATVSFEQAACLGTAGVTAWNGLIDKAQLRPGQSVFINGCSGAVGEAGVQIARMFGAEVSGSCGAEGIERARSLGLQTVYDYRVNRRIHDFRGIRRGVRCCSERSRRQPVSACCAKGGTFTTVEPTPVRFLRAVFDRRMKPIVGKPRADLLDRLAKAAHDRTLVLPIAETVPLAQAIPLISAIEAGRKLRGKVVVTIG